MTATPLQADQASSPGSDPFQTPSRTSRQQKQMDRSPGFVDSGSFATPPIARSQRPISTPSATPYKQGGTPAKSTQQPIQTRAHDLPIEKSLARDFASSALPMAILAYLINRQLLRWLSWFASPFLNSTCTYLIVGLCGYLWVTRTKECQLVGDACYVMGVMTWHVGNAIIFGEPQPR